MANKTRIITSINEWKTFQSESRKVLDSFISGEISDIIYNESCLDTLYISLDKQELKLDLKFYIPIETVFVFSSVVDLISIEKLQGVSNFVFSDCLLGELEIYSSEMSKLSFNNCTIGFLDILSLQAKTVLLMDSHIDELNIIRSKLKRLKIVQTSIDLGNVDLCTFFKSFLKNCYMGKVFIGEVLLPIVKVDIYTKLETNLCLLTYLKSVGIHKYIEKYFQLGGVVCEDTLSYLQDKLLSETVEKLKLNVSKLKLNLFKRDQDFQKIEILISRDNNLENGSTFCRAYQIN